MEDEKKRGFSHTKQIHGQIASVQDIPNPDKRKKEGFLSRKPSCPTQKRQKKKGILV